MIQRTEMHTPQISRPCWAEKPSSNLVEPHDWMGPDDLWDADVWIPASRSAELALPRTA